MVVYILESKKDGDLYVGLTNDLKKRFKLHNEGKVYATHRRRPLKLIFYEAHLNKYDAAKREKFLKTGWGKNWIKRTIKNYFSSSKVLSGKI